MNLFLFFILDLIFIKKNNRKMSEYDSTTSTRPPTPPIRYDSTKEFNCTTSSILNRPLPKTPDEDEALKKTKTKQTKG